MLKFREIRLVGTAGLIAFAMLVGGGSQLALAACVIPVVTSISPASGPASGGTSVEITGIFCGTLAVKFGNTAATYTVNSSTSITATSPAGTGTVHITVTGSSGTSTATAADQFTYGSSVQSQVTSLTTTIANASGVAVSNAIDSGIQDGFSDGGSPTTFSPTGAFVSINDQPRSQIAARAEEAFASIDSAGNKNKSLLFGEQKFGPLGYAGGFKKAPVANGQRRFEREWSAWADIRGTGWKVNEASGNGNDIKGNQFNLTAGLGRKLNTDTLLGVIAGYEYFKFDVASLNGSLKGNGETIGSYFSHRFGSDLRFDAALAWTYLNYSSTSGTATGSFNAGRWLATTGLTGNQRYGAYMFEPSAKLYVLWEQEKAWTDSTGAAQAARNFSAGRTALGSNVARSFASSGGWTVTPYVGVYGDWRFSSDNAIATGTTVAFIKGGWSGRVTTGISAAAKDGTVLSLGGEYGGLGANFKVWTGNVRATVPFGAQVSSR